ncbi:MAG: DUF58 domain-containing protein [Planctomycetes bacterium]|nr:DUF58 domain-containing protein [Planctomycetota bacterium]
MKGRGTTLSGSTLLDEDFIAKIEQLEIVSRKIITGKLKGERRSKRRGHSSEFADYRQYVSGDDLRFLDWNIYGRLDRLFIRLFEEQEDLWVNILIDCSRSMRFGEPDKFDYARRIAAALGYIGLSNHDRVRIAGFSDRLRTVFAPARGRRQVQRLLRVLEDLAPDGEGVTDLQRGCREFALAQKLSGVVILVTDFFDRRGFEGALRYLLSGGAACEFFVFHILAPQELEPELAGDLKLLDVEDGVPAEVSISAALLKSYRRNLEAFRAGIQQYCTRRGMQYVFSSTGVPFDRLILDYLRQRGLLG